MFGFTVPKSTFDNFNKIAGGVSFSECGNALYFFF
jgi:hypothetical protein